MQVIGILTKPKLPLMKATLANLVAWLRARGKDVVLDAKTAAAAVLATKHAGRLAEKADMVLVLGGDGTMLRAARMVEEHGVPILGINMGGLGFLTETGSGHLYETLERVFAKDFQIEERLMLQARLNRGGKRFAQATVLNDVVITKGTLSRMIGMTIDIDGRFVTRLRGDGLILSTPTGSTAYSMSAGGPIVSPAVKAVLVTPISPHTLTHRPLLVPGTATLAVTLTTHDKGARVTFDGQIGVALRERDTVTITPSSHATKLIRFPEQTYYDVLRQKLKWGDE
ncbi:MAG: NAD(+)/NADH kinase [Nitrospira sp.]